MVFILSVAIAAGSILLSAKLRSAFKADAFSTLLYYQTFYFTFGFYAFWGQVILASVFSAIISRELLHDVTTILVLLGAPFALFTWLMLIRFTRELSGGAIKSTFIFWFLSGNILFALMVGYAFSTFSSFDPYKVIKFCFILLNFGYTLAGVAFLLFSGKKMVALCRTDRRKLAAGLLLVVLLQNGTLMFYDDNVFVGLVFIFLFFTGGAFLPFYLRYQADLTVYYASSAGGITFETFCRTHEISPREQDIIRAICQGLSNQQIADKLFISLQTVKDHTSRIYFKTNCSSRARLIAMLNEKVQD